MLDACEESLCDGKCCFVTRRVRCVRSVALRREVLLSNEKWLRSSCLNASKPFRRLRRHFSQASPALLDGLRPSLPAASFRRTSQMFFAFSSALPTLLAGFACSSRGFSNRTSRQFHRHFSNVYSLPGSSAAPFPPRWNIAAFNSASDKLPPAESAKSFSTLGSSDSFSGENLLR